MLNIGKYARALPSLLDLKERGTGPREFSEQVVGTIELTQLYLLQNRETVASGATGALVVGVNLPTVPLVVPAGEIWFVHLMNTTVAPGAGAQADIAPAVIFDGSTTMCVGAFVNAAATQQARAISQAPFVATPGSSFGLIVRSVTLTPVADVSLLVTKLKL
jgi:hypothetical protein